MQSIRTKYLGPTDTQGSRVIARASGGCSITIGWDDARNHDGNHNAAAIALCKKMGWKGQLAVGGAADGGNVYVFIKSYCVVEV